MVEEFIDHLLSERGLSINTAEAYQKDIQQFLEITKGDFSLQGLIGYIHHLYGLGLAPSSMRRKLSAARQYLLFLRRKGIVKEDPFEELERPRGWERLPKFLTLEEVEKLLNAPDTSTPIGIRDRAILELMYASGLRVSEVCNLKVEDLDFNQGLLFVKQSKGKKDRIVPVNSVALNWINRYLRVRKHHSPFLFLSTRGRPLTRQRIWQMIKEYAVKAGIDPKKVHPHVIRHSFATHILLRGADLRSVQELLGHASIKTTQVYTEVAQPELERAYRRVQRR